MTLFKSEIPSMEWTYMTCLRTFFLLVFALPAFSQTGELPATLQPKLTPEQFAEQQAFFTPEACRTCDGSTLVVDEATVIDLSGSAPAITGETSLSAYLTMEKEGGNAANWTAVLDLSGRGLRLTNGGSITLATVKTERGLASPGLRILTTCDVVVEYGASIGLQSQDAPSGDLDIRAKGDILITGEVFNRNPGNWGRTGNLSVAVGCGQLQVTPQGLVELRGSQEGGGDIRLLAFGENGNLLLKGLVDAHFAYNRSPNIHVAAFAGQIRIDGTRLRGLEQWTNRRIASGITLRSEGNYPAGDICIVAKDMVEVIGFGNLPYATEDSVTFTLETPLRNGGLSVPVTYTLTNGAAGSVDVSLAIPSGSGSLRAIYGNLLNNANVDQLSAAGDDLNKHQFFNTDSTDGIPSYWMNPPGGWDFALGIGEESQTTPKTQANFTLQGPNLTWRDLIASQRDGWMVGVMIEPPLATKRNETILRIGTMVPTFIPDQQFGTVAIKTKLDGKGGELCVQSLEDSIYARDWAFDPGNHDNRDGGAILEAMVDIELKATYDGSAAGDGGPILIRNGSTTAAHGGATLVRSYTGWVFVRDHAVLDAQGSNVGSNRLIACLGVVNNGRLLPADADTSDDSGTCPSDPEIAIVVPEEGALLNQRPVTFSGTFAPAQAVVYLDGDTVQQNADGTWQFEKELADGPHTVNAQASVGDNTATTSVNFMVDTTPPQINLNAPETVTIGDSLNFTWTVTDLSEVQVVVLLNGTQISTQANGNYSLQVPLETSLPPYDIRISAVDAAGNAAPNVQQLVNVVVPDVSVSITTPTAGSLTNQNQIEVRGTVIPADASVTLNGEAAQVNGGDWSITLALVEEGTIALNARTQAFGQTAVDSRTITRDATPPVLTFTAPDTINGGDGLSYSWTATDETELATTQLTRDGTTVSEDADGQQDFTPDVNAGQVSFQLVATDTAGNQAQQDHVTTVVVPEELVVAITSPDAGSFTNADTITVTGTVSDESASVTLNGFDATVTGTAWEVLLTLDIEGEITLNATATRGIEEATASRTIIRDVTPPVLSFQAPDQIDQGDTFAYTWSATDETELATTLLTQDGVTISEEANGDGNVTPGDEVTQVDFVLTASDRAGNEASQTHTTLVVPPDTLVVAISSPADGSYTNADSVTVNGSVSDETATVTLNGIDAVVTGNTWQAELPLNSEGSITLEAIASRDDDEATDSRSIIRDVTPPTLTLTIPDTVDEDASFDFSWLAEDETALDNVSLERDSTLISSDAEGTDNMPAPADRDQVTFSLEASDLAGNTAQTEATINIIREALSIAISSPAAGTITSEDVITVSGTVTPTEAAVTVNGVTATNNNGDWSADVPLESQGTITLTAVASHEIETVQASVDIIREMNPPVVTIDAPLTFIRGEPYTITVDAESDSNINAIRFSAGPLTFEPTTNNPATYSFTVPTDEPADTYSLTAEADNEANLTGTATIDVPVRNIDEVDRVVVTITSHESDATYAETEQIIRGNVVPADAQVSVAGQDLSVDAAGEFELNKSLHTGINTLLFRGTREGYLPGTAKLDLFLDTFDPIVVIEYPENGLRTNQASVTISGTVSDQYDAEPSLTRNGEVVSHEGGRFNHRNVALQPGENIFTYTATDSLGNQGSASVTVYYRNAEEGPSITLNHPPAVQIGSDYAVTVFAEPLADIARLELYVNNQLQHSAENGESYTANLTQSGLTRSIPVLAIAEDRYGNRAEATGEILVARPHFIYGQVLADATSYPLSGIDLTLRTPLQTQQVTTAADGSYETTIYGYPLEVIAANPQYATIARHMAQPQDHWRVPDLRLTERNGSNSGPSVAAGNQSLDFAGSLAMTPLGQQAIPELLPLGLSPVAAFEAHQVSAANGATWRAMQLPQSLDGASLLLLQRENQAWRVLATPTASGRTFTLPIEALANGAYLLARVDAWSDLDQVEVGSLIQRNQDPVVPPNTISRANTSPERASIFDNPLTTYTCTVQTRGEIRSGARAQVIVNEIHERYSETLRDPAFPLDFHAYSYRFGSHAEAQRLGANLNVRARRQLIPDLTRRAELLFDTRSGTVSQATYPETPLVSLGDLTLDMAGTDTVPHPVQASLRGNQTTVTLPPGATHELGFNLEIGGTLARSPQLAFIAPPAPAMVLLRKDTHSPHWLFITQLQHDGEVWRNQPDDAHLLASGEFALVRLNTAHTLVSGTVRNSGSLAPGAYVHARQLPWRAISDASGNYQLLVPQTDQQWVLQANLNGSGRSGQLNLPPTQGRDQLSNQDISMTPRAFFVRFSEPADGSRHLNLLPEFRVEFNLPVTAEEANLTTSITLTSVGGSDVPLQFVAEEGREVLNILPNNALLPGADYTLNFGTDLQSLSGDLLSETYQVQFSTRIETLPVDLDLSQFFLEQDQDTLFLAAPAEAFPSGTVLRVRNPNNGYGETFTLGSSNVRRQVLADLGEPIELRATAPNGSEQFRTIGLTQVGENTYRLGPHPFSLRLSDNLILRVDDVVGDFAAEVRFEAVPAADIEAYQADIAGLEEAPDMNILQSFTIERVDSDGPLPQLTCRLQLEQLPPSLVDGNLFSMSYTPNIMAPADPTNPTELSPQTLFGIEDILEVEGGVVSSANKTGKRALLGTMMLASVGGFGGLIALSISSTEVPLNPSEYPIRGIIGTLRQNNSWEPPIEVPYTEGAQWHSEIPGGYYPVPGVPVYRAIYVGDRPVFKFLGTSRGTGRAVVDFFGPPPTNHGVSIRGLDPATNQIAPIEITGTLILNQNPATMGFSLGNVFKAWAKFQPDQYTVDLGNPPPVPTLGVRWEVLQQNDSGQWVVDAPATERLRDSRRIRSNAFSQLRMTVISSQPIANEPEPSVSMRGGIPPQDDYEIDGQSVIYTFPAGVIGQGGTLTTTVTINTTLGSSNTISDSFMVLSDAPQPSVAGPPYVLFTNPEDEAKEVLVDKPIVVAFSEPVANINGSTLQLFDMGEGDIDAIGGGTNVSVRYLDQNGEAIESNDIRASVVHMVPEQALNFDHTYRIQVRNVLDQEDLEPSEDHYSRFQTLPFEKVDETPIHYHTTLRTVRNLTVVLGKDMNQQGNLWIYDTRNGRLPMQEVSSQLVEWKLLPPSWEFPRFEIFLPNDFDQGTNAVNDSVALDDLPAGTIFAVVGQRFPDNVSYLTLWRYTGNGGLEEILLFPNLEAGLGYATAKYRQFLMIGYKIFDYTDLDPQNQGRTVVIDLKRLMEELQPLEEAYASGALNRIEYEQQLIDLASVATYPTPGNITDITVFQRKEVDEDITRIKPGFLLSAQNRPAMFNFDLEQQPAFPGAQIPSGDPDFDDRLIARTNYPAGQTFMRHDNGAVMDFVYRDPVEGFKEVDLAVFMSRYPQNGTGHVQVFEIPRTADMNRSLIQPLKTLNFDHDLYSIAVDSDTGLVAIQGMDGRMSILDLRVFLESTQNESGFENPAFMFAAEPAESLHMMEFSEGNLYGLNRSGRQLYRYPVAPKQYRLLGWEYLDLADWNQPADEDSEAQTFGTTTKFSPYMVFYATDMLIEDTRKFVMEQGTFAIELLESADITIEIKDLLSDAVVAEVRRNQEDTSGGVQAFSFTELRDYFKRTEVQASLREQGVLPFELKYVVESDGQITLEDTTNFLVAYRYPDTRYIDHYRNLGGIDALSMTPELFEIDHTVSSIDDRLDLSASRAYSFDYALQSGPYGPGMLNGWMLYMGLPIWWDIAALPTSSSHDATHAHPRLFLEQPGRFGITFEIDDSLEKAIAKNDLASDFELKDGRWELLHRKEMAYIFETGRELPNIEEIFEGLNGDRDDQEAYRYPLIRFGAPNTETPPGLLGETTLRTMRDMRWDNQLKFRDDQERAAAKPTKVIEEINDTGGNREVRVAYQDTPSGYQVTEARYADDGMNLTYTYDAEGYLQRFTRGAGSTIRQTTYEWDELGDAYQLGNFKVKRLINVSVGSGAEAETTEFEYQGFNVNQVSTAFGDKALTSQRDQSGMITSVSIAGLAPSPSQGLVFSLNANEWLSSNRTIGSTSFTHTWERKQAENNHQSLFIAADSSLNQSFTYDNQGRLTQHSRNGGSQSWSYGNPGAFAYYPSGFRNAEDEMFEIQMNASNLMIQSDGDKVEVKFSSSGAKRSEVDALGLEFGAPRSQHYIPVGNGFEAQNGRQIKVPFPGQSVPMLQKGFGGVGDDLVVRIEDGIDTVYSNFDSLGRPQRILMYGDQVVYNLEYAYENGRFVEKTTEFDSGTLTEVAYDERGLVIESKTTLGENERTLTYFYDDLDRLIRVEVAPDEGTIYTATFNDNTHLPQTVTSEGITTSFNKGAGFFPTINGVTVSENNLSRSISFQTNQLGQIVEAEEQGSGVKRFTYDPFGRIIHERVVGPNNQTMDAAVHAFTPGEIRSSYSLREADRTVRFLDSTGLNRFVNVTGSGVDQPVSKVISTAVESTNGKGYIYRESHSGGEVPQTLIHNAQGDNLGGSNGQYQFEANVNELGKFGEPLRYSGAHTIEFESDETGRYTEMIDTNGHRQTRQYDILNRETRGTDSRNKSFTMGYFGSTDDINDITVNGIDADGDGQTKILEGQSRTESTSQGWLGGSEQRSMEALDQRFTLTKNGNSASAEYDPASGLLQRISGFSGEETTFEWIIPEKRLRIDAPGEAPRIVEYDYFGEVRSVTQAGQTLLRIERDADGRIKRVTRPTGSFDFVYNGADLVAIDGGNLPITFSDFNQQGKPARFDFGDFANFELDFHQGGTPSEIRTRSRGGKSATLRANSHGDVTFIQSGSNPALQFTYNDWGAPATMQMGTGPVNDLFSGDSLRTLDLPGGITIELDAYGKVIAYAIPGIATRTYSYDEASRLAAVSANGQRLRGYERLNHRLDTIHIGDDAGALCDPNQLSFTYDDWGRVEQITSQVDGVSAYSYYEEGPHQGRLERYTDPNQVSRNYQYDSAGNTAAIRIVDGPTFNYNWSEEGNLNQVQVDDMATEFGDYEAGYPGSMRWKFNDSTIQDFAIEGEGGQVNTIEGGEYLVDLEWQGDLQVSQMVRRGPGMQETITTTYQDGMLAGVRMVRITGSTPGADECPDCTTTTVEENYDPTQRMLKGAMDRSINGQAVLAQTHVNDSAAASNRLSGMTSPQGNALIGYDDLGNVVDLSYPWNAVDVSLSYDCTRKVREVHTTRPGQSRSENYRYDEFNRRISNTGNPQLGNLVYVYEDSRVLAIGIKEANAVNWTHAFGYGPLGPVFVKDLTGTGNSYFILSDHLGTPFAYRDAATGETYFTPYNPWGELWAPQGERAPPYVQAGETGGLDVALPPDPIFAFTPLGLSGHIYDHNTGLVYMHHRFYHPRAGQFLTHDFRVPNLLDPSSFNQPYAYANGNPMAYWDPNGQIPALIPLLLKAGVSGGADFLMQVVFAYLFDPEVERIEQAIDQVNWIDVARATGEGLIPWRVPGGALGEAALDATSEVLDQAIKQGSAYTQEMAINDFAFSFFISLGGGGVTQLIGKYGAPAVAEGLRKIGFNPRRNKALSNALPPPPPRKPTSAGTEGGQLRDQFKMCFVAGTLIPTKIGMKPIEKIEPGDWVLSADEKTGIPSYQQVLQTFKTSPTTLFHVTYIGSDLQEQTLQTTAEHPFFVQQESDWVPAEALKVGHALVLANGKKAEIIGVHQERGPPGHTFETYNFEVANTHTYFAAPPQTERKTIAEHAVWVHNTGPRKCNKNDSELDGNQAKPSTSTTHEKVDPTAARPPIIERAEKAKSLADDVPGTKGFAEWFNKLDPDEFDRYWNDVAAKKKIENRIRHPGGYHEWLKVSQAPKLKRLGYTAEELWSFRTPTKKLKWVNPYTGRKGSHGRHGSGKFHLELDEIIDQSKSKNEVYAGMVQLALRWSIPNLPKNIRR